MSREPRLFRADAVADATGFVAQPGAVLVAVDPGGGRLPELLASGTPEAVGGHEAARHADVTDLPRALLLPALVNAHTHLDLTHIGPRPFDPADGFAGWARMIIANRLAGGPALEDSVREGVRLTRAGGVMAIGDIAGVMRPEPARVLDESGLLGVSYLEYFGLGARQDETIEQLTALLPTLGVSGGRGLARTRLGLQPHAPYTAGPRLLEWTARQRAALGMPPCTHLAETLAEREFVAHAAGPFRALLESLGLWNDTILPDVGRGMHPIAHVAPSLRAAPWLLAHVNDCDDAGMRVLAESGASVAYCPRSSHYFRNHESFGPHRYRGMLAAGINVCLGTDSIVNLPADESDRLSTLDEMRFLFRRDGADPLVLLRMATLNGARALGLDPSLFTLAISRGPRPLAGLIAMPVERDAADPTWLHAIMRSRAAPCLLTP